MVQLLIYPSFRHYHPSTLKKWHPTYSKRIALIVIPLMVGQLAYGMYNVFYLGSPLVWLKLLLVISVWIVTFAIFVPLHNAVEKTNDGNMESLTLKLVQKNWSRTLLWTIIFLLGMLQAFIPDLS